MNLVGPLLIPWDWEPSVVFGCVSLLLVYLLAARDRTRAQTALFVSGVVVLLLSLVSPLDTLGDYYLVSVHMIQHLLMVLIVPPLLILGLPASLTRALLRPRLMEAFVRVRGGPLFAWLIGNLTLWIWHLPALYNRALENETVHIIEHLCFLFSACVFWFPILSTAVEYRISAPASLIYMMAAGMANTLLGIFIAYAPNVLYAAYASPVDALGLLSLLRHAGYDPKGDQELAGLLMWFPGSLPHITIMLARLMSWFSAEEKIAFS